jgi:hypothetical protein
VPGIGCTNLVALESLSLHLSLSTLEWTFLLRRLTVPKLRDLDIEGDVSFFSLSEFLQRHPSIQEMNLNSLSHNPLLPPGTYRRLTYTIDQPSYDIDSKAAVDQNPLHDSLCIRVQNISDENILVSHLRIASRIAY